MIVAYGFLALLVGLNLGASALLYFVGKNIRAFLLSENDARAAFATELNLRVFDLEKEGQKVLASKPAVKPPISRMRWNEDAPFKDKAS